MSASLEQALALMTLIGLSMSCQAQVEPTEHMILGAGIQRMPSADGDRFSADWVRSAGAGVFSTGMEMSNTDANRWTLVGIGGARQYANGRWMLSGDLDVGPATTGTEDYTLAKLRAELSFRMANGWTYSIQDMFVDVHPVRGHVISASARSSRPGGIGHGVTLSGSASGNLDEQSLSYRFDYRAKPPYMLAGLVVGTSNNRLLLQTAAAAATTTRFEQAFAGLIVPTEKGEITLVVDAARIGEVRRTAFSIAFRFPVELYE